MTSVEWIGVLLGTTIIMRTFLVGWGVFYANRTTAHSRRNVWMVVGILSLWMGIAIPGLAGMFDLTPTTTPPPPLAAGVLVPLLTMTLLFFTWQPFRRVILAVPLPWIIGLHFYRNSIGSFLWLWGEGQLPGIFAFPVALGDLLMGLTALPLAYGIAKNHPLAKKLVGYWNVFGIAELLTFVPLGILTSDSAMQLLAFDNPNRLTTAAPLVLAPLCYVPFAIFLHICALDRLRTKRFGVSDRPPINPIWFVLTCGATIIGLYAIGAYFVIPFVSGNAPGFHVHPNLGAALAAQLTSARVHIGFGAMALLSGVWQFLPAIRERWPLSHRRLGYVYVLGVIVSALAGINLAGSSFAGWSSRIGFTVLGSLWLLFTIISVVKVKRKQFSAHRVWMVRSYALGLAAVTLRINNFIFFRFGLDLPDFHFLNAWLCWLPNLALAELYLRRGSPLQWCKERSFDLPVAPRHRGHAL